MKTDVTLVIPLRNEGENLRPLYEELVKYLPKSRQIVFVEDSSTDDSLEILKELKRIDDSVAILELRERSGLGPSILQGILFSAANNVLVMDSDLTHDPRVIPLMLSSLEESSLVIASRYMPGGSMEPKSIFLGSKLFAWVLRSLFRIKTKDIFGGYLAFRHNDFVDFINEHNFSGFGEYSMKMCIFAESRDLLITELPCTFRSRAGGEKKSRRIKMFRDYFISTAMFKLRIRMGDPPK